MIADELAKQARDGLQAKIEEAVRRAFDAGKDFIASVEITTEPDLFEAFSLHDATVTISRKGGPVTPGRQWGPEWTVYRRPADWKRRA